MHCHNRILWEAYARFCNDYFGLYIAGLLHQHVIIMKVKSVCCDEVAVVLHVETPQILQCF